MVEKLLEEFSGLCEVEAIALGGSRSGTNFDEKSDYDVYIYCISPISEESRRAIIEKYCRVMEIGNRFWEYEDNCTLNNGVDIDLIYRELGAFAEEIASVVERFQARNGYTTCMWHNLMNCRVIFDRNGRLARTKERFNIPYPDELRRNIITRNLDLLCNSLPAYNGQIKKALSRNDRISVLHRTTAFLESYFDVIFALNRLTHPGEKRLVELCEQTCPVLPRDFKGNLDRLFEVMFTDSNVTEQTISVIIAELKSVTAARTDNA